MTESESNKGALVTIWTEFSIIEAAINKFSNRLDSAIDHVSFDKSFLSHSNRWKSNGPIRNQIVKDRKRLKPVHPRTIDDWFWLRCGAKFC